jgi:L-glutamine-phosphate cytidylyltransferase
MKAVILAAGQGTRIRSAHGERPKCLITFNNSNWTILDQQIQSLWLAGVKDIAIVVGYEKDQIIRHITINYRVWLDRFTFIENPEFARTNNIYSLWLARTWVTEDSFVCLNSDVVFEPAILPPALCSTAPITMIVDRAWREETMKVVIAGHGIVRMGKQIPEQEFSATYIGLTVFHQRIVKEFLARINRLVRDGQKQIFFNVAVQQLADEGVEVGFTETGELAWTEIDDPVDLAFARLYILSRLAPATLAA